MLTTVTFEFEFIANDTVAYATVKGHLEPNDIKRLYHGLIAFSCSKQTFNLLVDFRDTSMHFDSQTVLELVKQVGCITSGYRVARVYPKTDFRQYIIEEYANRLSIPIRNFTNEIDAIDWLLESQDQ